MFPPPAALPPTRRAGAGRSSGNALRSLLRPPRGWDSPVLPAGLVPLRSCPGSSRQGALGALSASMGVGAAPRVLLGSARFWGAGKPPGIPLWGSSSRGVTEWVPSGALLEENGISREFWASPPALDPPAHGASLPAALGLPGPGVPAEEADREGGLLHRGVQDPAGPRVRHGVPGKRWVRGELWGGLGCAVSRRMPACFSITSPSLFHLFPVAPQLWRGVGGARCSPPRFPQLQPRSPCSWSFPGLGLECLEHKCSWKTTFGGDGVLGYAVGSGRMHSHLSMDSQLWEGGSARC